MARTERYFPVSCICNVDPQVDKSHAGTFYVIDLIIVPCYDFYDIYPYRLYGISYANAEKYIKHLSIPIQMVGFLII